MNHNYSIIYNSALGEYQVVSEKTKSRRSKARKLIVTTLMGLLLSPAVADISLGGIITHLPTTDGSFTLGIGSSFSVYGKNIILAGLLNPQSTGNIGLNSYGSLLTVNGGSAIYIVQAGKGSITTSVEGSIFLTGDRHYGIYNTIDHADSRGNISIKNSNTITTIGDSSHAIYARHQGKGNIDVTISGDISTEKQKAHGVYALINNIDSMGSILINQSHNLTTTGYGAHAIYAAHKGDGDVTITSNGHVNTVGEMASGVVAISQGKIIINNYANITVKNQGANGIVASSERASTKASVNVLVGANSVVDASRANHGISLETVSAGQIQIDSGAKVIGGEGAGIRFAIMNSGQSQYSIENSGHVSSDNDQAVIVNGSNASSQLDFTNIGTVQGIITSDGNTALNMNNTGEFLLRHQSDGIKKVAISQFNGGVLDNIGIIKLMAVKGVTSIDPTNEYTPSGALSMSNEGIEHGQLLGVKEFNHNKMLDLTGSGLSGNVLVISGSNVAGIDGQGTFVTNGGVVKIATTLNSGGTTSRSDILVVDNIKLGTSASKIDIIIAEGSNGMQTNGSGIQIIQTLGTQDHGAFKLLHPVTYGNYEYLLFSDNGSGVENGYYLRSYRFIDPIPIFLPNPNVGAYLGNQYAATNIFNQNILSHRSGTKSPDQKVWGHIGYSEIKTDHISNTQKLKIENTLIQLGVDLYQDHASGQLMGLYAGYGKSDIKNRSKLTKSEAKGSVEGIQIGAYYSWLPQEAEGPYVDIWGYYAHFRNQLHGDTQRGLNKKYDGYGLSLSVKAGYGFVISESNQTKWILEPHAQIAYNYINTDDFIDYNNTRFSSNKAQGFDLRLGARVYGYHPEDARILPFAELNWLYNDMDNAVHVNGLKESSRIARNVAEFKLGLQGNLSSKANVFAHVGIEKGKNKYQKTKLQIRFNYLW